MAQPSSLPEAVLAGKEDAGYLVTFLTHERTGKSMLAVYDAATMDTQPVAVVPLPARVPAGAQHPCYCLLSSAAHCGHPCKLACIYHVPRCMF